MATKTRDELIAEFDALTDDMQSVSRQIAEVRERLDELSAMKRSLGGRQSAILAELQSTN